MEGDCALQEQNRETTTDQESKPIKEEDNFLLPYKSDQNQNNVIKRALDSPVATSSPCDKEGCQDVKKVKLEDVDLIVRCGLCLNKPQQVPLYGCKSGHYVCNKCRSAGGILLSCPKCLDPDLSEHLIELENKIYPLECSFQVKGCKQRLSEDLKTEHESECVYRLVQCPNRLFARSCTFYDSFITIRDHGRSAHGFNKCCTKLTDGLITCKMMHPKDEKTGDGLYSCSAKFPPIELEFDQKLFYCYYERKNSRGLWFFFIRVYGSESLARSYQCNIYLGAGNSDKSNFEDCSRSAKLPCVHYGMDKQAIQESGCCLTVDDAGIRSLHTGPALFRVWWKVSKRKVKKTE